jgi:hypothetical protein
MLFPLITALALTNPLSRYVLLQVIEKPELDDVSDEPVTLLADASAQTMVKKNKRKACFLTTGMSLR